MVKKIRLRSWQQARTEVLMLKFESPTNESVMVDVDADVAQVEDK